MTHNKVKVLRNWRIKVFTRSIALVHYNAFSAGHINCQFLPC